MTGESGARPLLATEFNEFGATLSPDKRWIAYYSNRTGRSEIWVASYPNLEQQRPVSFEGGVEPRWSDDGKELYYRVDNKMMAVAVNEDDQEISIEPPRVLFKGDFWRGGWPTYGVAPDGRFLMIQRAEEPTKHNEPHRIRIVLNWFEELERLVPTDRL